LLEFMTIEGCKGCDFGNVSAEVLAALTYIRDNIVSFNVSDPANSNNSLSDDLDAQARRSIRSVTDDAIKAQYWNDVFT
jgi:hypothetical protein